MDKFKILTEGYARFEGDILLASPTSTLIYSGGKKVLVDPGANETLLLNRLGDEGLTTDEIDIVFLTHYHPDHILNIRLFSKHPIYDGETIYEGDQESFFKERLPGTDIEIIPTPGHALEHAALKFNTDLGVVVVAADVFWWMDGEQKSDTYDDLINNPDTYARDMTALLESRKKVLEVADWIIPGHGKMFKNPLK